MIIYDVIFDDKDQNDLNVHDVNMEMYVIHIDIISKNGLDLSDSTDDDQFTILVEG
jgi:hypothetical protein